MPKLPEHPYDGISDELFSWMNEEVDYHVGALQGDHRAPFSADVTQKELKDYWSRQMFEERPDGSVDYTKVNAQGRDAAMKALGPQKYAETYTQVAPKQQRGRRGLPDPFSPAETAPPNEIGYPMPEDQEPVPEV